MNGSSSHFIESYHLLSYATIDSTNEEAKRLAEAGAQHGAVIWAEMQTHGKGRQEREWISQPGNLFCSLLLKPCATPDFLPQLSFVASLALDRALRDVVPAHSRVSLKWPNDVLLDGRKLAGILLETLPDTVTGTRWVIIGVGVNVDHSPQQTMYPATSLKETGVEIISAKIVLSRFLDCFEPLYDEWIDKGFAHIAAQWLERAEGFGQQVELDTGDQRIRGRFVGLDPQGQLQLEQVDGGITAHAAGDVRLGVTAHATDD